MGSNIIEGCHTQWGCCWKSSAISLNNLKKSTSKNVLALVQVPEENRHTKKISSKKLRFFRIKGAAETNVLALGWPTSSGTGLALSTLAPAKATTFDPPSPCRYTVFVIKGGSPGIQSDALRPLDWKGVMSNYHSDRVPMPDIGLILTQETPHKSCRCKWLQHLR